MIITGIILMYPVDNCACGQFVAAAQVARGGGYAGSNNYCDGIL
jgi:hypothetical protein